MGFFDNEPSPKQIEAAKARLNELPIILRASKIWYLTAIIGTIFTILGVFMASQGEKSAYFIIPLFAAVAAVGIYILSPAGPVLTIDKEGFEYSTLFSKQRVKWNEIKNVGIWRSRHAKNITWNWTDAALANGGRKKAFGSGLMGFMASYQNFYAIDLKELMVVMEIMRQTYGN